MRSASRSVPAIANHGTTGPVLHEVSPRAPVTHMVYLHPGQLYASAESCVITTILGSCVSVCLFDRDRGIGGANHYLLPQYTRDSNDAGRYGPTAVRQLVRRLIELGARADHLEARVAGGANMLSAFQAGERHLGLRNVDVARQVLREARIPIVAEDVGGIRGRKLAFATGDGTAWVRVI